MSALGIEFGRCQNLVEAHVRGLASKGHEVADLEFTEVAPTPMKAIPNATRTSLVRQGQEGMILSDSNRARSDLHFEHRLRTLCDTSLDASGSNLIPNFGERKNDVARLYRLDRYRPIRGLN